MDLITPNFNNQMNYGMQNFNNPEQNYNQLNNSIPNQGM